MSQKINLATALKYKKRLKAAEAEAYKTLNSASNIIQYDPQYPDEFDADIRELLEAYSDAAEKYQAITQYIAEATVKTKVSMWLTKIDRLKNILSFLNNLQTKTVNRRTREDGMPYDVKIQISEDERRGMIKKYTDELYAAQDVIDTINGSTMIEIPDGLVK